MKTNYFNQTIARGQIFGRYVEPLSASTAVAWATRIYAELSPENLSCDGELPAQAVAEPAGRN